MAAVVVVFVRIIACVALVGAGLVLALTGAGVAAHVAASLLIGAGVTAALLGAFLRGVAPGRRSA